MLTKFPWILAKQSLFCFDLTFIPFFKLLGKRIYPNSSVKYLGIRIDQYLDWKSYISETSIKLWRANGALSKLEHYIPLKTLVNIYHAIFSSHMRYACQVWGLCDNVACHRILTLQKLALRLITFSAPRTPSNPIFSDPVSYTHLTLPTIYSV